MSNTLKNNRKRGDLQHVEGNSSINIGKVPPVDGNGPSWLWVQADFKARRLEKNREKFNNPQ